MKHFYLFLFLFLLCTSHISASDPEKNKSSSFFIQPELLIGKVLHANSNFPDTRLQRTFSISFGKYVQDPSRIWSVFYNYPSVGVTVSYTYLGHQEILGNALTVMPFITLSTSKKQAGAFYFKLGLGASYFTKYYDAEQNPTNLAIGSHVTWAFESTVHYNVFVTPRISLSIGAGLIHNSNGHAQLPNLGLNALLLSFSSRFYLKPLTEQQLNGLKKPVLKRSIDFIISARTGLGFHELGGATSSIGNKKKFVHILSASGGIILKRSIKLSVGFTYRFYQHYYDYLAWEKSAEYSDNTAWNASNVYLFVGCELFIGYVSMDAQLGLNLHKPFYPEFNREFEDDSDFNYWLKRTFNTRLGLKIYAINTSANPKNNVFIGIHINANFGQADFSALSIGYVYRFGSVSNK